MTELTLESLAARVAALERAAGMPPGAIPLKNGYYVIPGTGNWEEAFAAMDELRDTYDFDAFDRAEELELRIAREQVEEWKRSQSKGDQP